MNAYVGAGYGITFAALAIYSAWVVRRERLLRRAVSPQESRPDEANVGGRRGEVGG
jgi:hypothetical protein